MVKQRGFFFVCFLISVLLLRGDNSFIDDTEDAQKGLTEFGEVALNLYENKQENLNVYCL